MLILVQDVPGYSGRQSRRRPQLSESEDGEPVSGRDLGKVEKRNCKVQKLQNTQKSNSGGEAGHLFAKYISSKGKATQPSRS